jgi:predicted O-linked N-acetylglucosamine transferase (SPINDLY family)
MSAPRASHGAPAPYLASAAALIGEGRFDEARTLLLRQIRTSAHPHALYMLAIAADALAEPDQALHYLQRAAAAEPHAPLFATALTTALADRARLPEAVALLEKFAATHPPDPGVASTLASALAELGRLDDALRTAESARATFGDLPDIGGALGAVLHKQGRVDEALAAYRRSGRIVKEGTLLQSLGRVEEAVTHFRAAAERYPDDDAAWVHYAYSQNYSDTAPAAEQARAHRNIGLSLRKRLGPAHSTWNVKRDPDRQLRIAIISPDLRRHAIVSFLAPLLENYSKPEWHITAYATSRKKDDVTARLRSLVDAWRDVPNPHPRYLASLIHKDRIDVAIELSGHTEGNAASAMHLRPAPVQATYLGYPNTTGMDTIDIRLVDSITDPPGESDALAVEKLIRIDPCFLCYKPIDVPRDVVVPPRQPVRTSGDSQSSLALGSFNLPTKISPRTLSLWSRVLTAIPNSTLTLKHAALIHDWMRAALAQRLAAAGIDASRVTVLPPTPSYADHLAAYSQIDIALDTFPYHGTTTTCEALWMGVPVVTLTGDRHASRVGTSVLSAIGLPDLAAPDEPAYIALVQQIAADRDRLRTWRTPGPQSLRSRMASSPLCDASAFSSRFQAAIRQAWQRWCAAGK